MIVSNEPGFYDPALGFGVRIENLLVISPAETEHAFNDKRFFRFERLTHVPIQRSLIMKELLSAEEVRWVDTYHRQVRAEVRDRVEGEALEWLERMTEPLG